ncbi:hypothetical protein D9757_015295 [Collybiopsis confluens]|uniref:JmjC domain-containing protein n=1 Tax=Collybiopsis confluens TaxID=2823264 RepID=A0A8H5CI50_9AGAR|nr:hypothetical protein D9757_015295 [Collybiopsis confluens]
MKLLVAPRFGSQEDILCPSEDIEILSIALRNTWIRKIEGDTQWRSLVRLSTAAQVEQENWSWPSHLGPILGFKLLCVLCGSSMKTGTIPRKVMSEDLSKRLRRVAKQLTQKPGWPSIFEEASAARWTHRGGVGASPSDALHPVNAAQTIAQSALQNLTSIHHRLQAKSYSNILMNIELAAAYLSVMTLVGDTLLCVCWKIINALTGSCGREHGRGSSNSTHSAATKVRSLPPWLTYTAYNTLPRFNPSQFDKNVGEILSEANISIVEFQAPLFSALAVSPILLFRTCLLNSSRFGRNHYISFLLTLGDMKPDKLRKIETLIWRNLVLVSRRQITAETMIDRVLDFVIPPETLSTFRTQEAKFKQDLRKYFSNSFNEHEDNIAFFFPDLGATNELDDSRSNVHSQPSPPQLQLPSSHNVSDSAGSSNSLPSFHLSGTRDEDSNLSTAKRVSDGAISASRFVHDGSSGAQQFVSPEPPPPDSSQASVIDPRVTLAAGGQSSPKDVLVHPSSSSSGTAGAPTLIVSHRLSNDAAAPVPGVENIGPFSGSEFRESAPEAKKGSEAQDMSITGLQASEVLQTVACSGSPGDTVAPATLFGPPHPGHPDLDITSHTAIVGGAHLNKMPGELIEERPESTDLSDSETIPHTDVVSGAHLSAMPGGLMEERHNSTDLSDSERFDTPQDTSLLPRPDLRITSTPNIDSSLMVVDLTTETVEDHSLLAPGNNTQLKANQPVPHIDMSDVSFSRSDSDTIVSDHPDILPVSLPQNGSDGAAADSHDVDRLDCTSPVPGPDIEKHHFPPCDTLNSVDDDLVPGQPHAASQASDDFRVIQTDFGASAANFSDSASAGANAKSQVLTDIGKDRDNSASIHRQSERIAKRKLETETIATSSKRPKTSFHLPRHRPKPKVRANSKRNDSQVSDPEESDEDTTIPRFIPKEDERCQRFPSGAVNVYSADGSRYTQYIGEHYRRQLVEDQEELARRVDQWRSAIDLPTGPPPEWSPSSRGVINISPVSTGHPDAPPVYTADYSDFSKKSAGEVQNLLRQYPVVILSNRPTRLMCDRNGLKEFGRLKDLRIIHDMTRFNENDGTAVFTRATYEDFFVTDKIVNYLHNPLGGASFAPPQLATDLRAAAKKYHGYPTSSYLHLMGWGLLAKAHAVHRPHVDRTGMCTWVAIEDGAKKWDIAFPPDANEQVSSEAYTYQLAFERNYDRGWRWCSFLLSPGSMLIMRPGVVHSVTTIQDCLAIGGHFFAASTIKLTVYSLYHSFVNSGTITNGAVEEEQQNLLRILLFWFDAMCKLGSTYLSDIKNAEDTLSDHVPNVLDHDGFENLFYIMVYAELVSVVTPNTYHVPLPADFDRAIFERPRKRSREMLRWLTEHFTLTVENGDSKKSINDLFLQSVLRHAHKLWDDVKQRDKRRGCGSTYFRDGVEREIQETDVYSAISSLTFVPNFGSLWRAESQNDVPISYQLSLGLGPDRYGLRLKV